MKKAFTISMSTAIVEDLKKVPMNRSAAITQAILNATRDNDLLARAFRLRLGMPNTQNEIRITYTRDSKLDAPLKKLIEMAKLPGEQVIRLCVEAYIHHL
jgi:hypothetical protein